MIKKIGVYVVNKTTFHEYNDYAFAYKSNIVNNIVLRINKF